MTHQRDDKTPPDVAATAPGDSTPVELTPVEMTLASNSPKTDSLKTDGASESPVTFGPTDSAATDSAVTGTAPVTDSAAEAAAAEPAREDVRQQAATSGGGSGFASGLAASLLVVAVAGAGAYATLPQWAPAVAKYAAPAEDPRVAATAGEVAKLRADLAALNGKTDQAVAALRADIAKLAAAPAPAAAAPAAAGADPAQLAALAQRLQALESRPAPAAADTSGLQQQIAQLQQLIDATAKNAVDSGSVLKLAQRVDSVEATARQTNDQRQSAQSLLLAVGQLRDALARGEGFDAELRAIKVLAPNDAEVTKSLEVIAGRAQKGVPTRAALSARFDQVNAAIVRAAVGPDEDGWLRQTLQRLSSVVSIRRVDGPAVGDTPVAVVGRAAKAMDANNLSGAVEELSKLQGPSAQAAAGWLADARARLAAEKAISDLSAHTVALVGGAAKG